VQKMFTWTAVLQAAAGRRLAPLCIALAALLICMLASAPAHAQASRTWISGVGDDVNPCSRTAPCKTFAGAISKTAAGGEINCLDPAGYGAVTITKAMTINCEETLGSMLVSETNAIVVAAAAGDIVTLKGLEFEGLKKTASPGLNAIRFQSGAELHVHKFQIRGFSQNGIDVVPTTASKIFISDGYISDCGIDAIHISPTAGLNAVINRVIAEGNVNGFIGNGNANGNFNINIRDSVVSEGTTGIQLTSSGATVTMMIDHTNVSSHSTVSVKVNGATATIRIGNSTISSNVTGVSVTTGTMQSFKNNQFAGNLSDGTPITAVPGNSETLQ